MKPTIVYILLALLAYQLAGSMVTNYLQIEAVRKEVKSKLKSAVPLNELIVIQLKNSELNALTWVRANKEFIYKGKMYDVVSKSIQTHSIRFVCITDTQEEALFKHLDDLVNMSSHAKKRPVSAVADNTEIRNATLIRISVNQSIGFKLLYNKKFGLQERNLAEQFKF